jgi:hypothetical protein
VGFVDVSVWVANGGLQEHVRDFKALNKRNDNGAEFEVNFLDCLKDVLWEWSASLEEAGLEAGRGVDIQQVESVEFAEIFEVLKVIGALDVTLGQSSLEVVEGHVFDVGTTHIGDVQSIMEVSEVLLREVVIFRPHDVMNAVKLKGNIYFESFFNVV